MASPVPVGLNGRDYLGQISGIVVTVISGGALVASAGAAGDAVTWQLYDTTPPTAALPNGNPIGDPGTATYISAGLFAFAIPAATLALFAEGSSGWLRVKLVRPTGGKGEWDALLYFAKASQAAS